VALLLGVAYGSSVGGMGTPIGTPPNLIFMEIYRETTGVTVGFTEYMTWAVPVVVLFVPLIGLWLTRGLGAGAPIDLPDPGPWQPAERRVLGIFALVAGAWVTRTEPFGGWSAWLGIPGANDATVAFLGCVLMAIIPDGRDGRLLDWEHAVRIPWGILLLFGSGVALASGFGASGLSELIGGSLGGQVAALPLPLVILAICLVVTFLTEVTSNTATATLLMPIMAAVSVSAGLDPRLTMLAVAFSASCAFMLPVATGPNAVVFGSERITVAEMTREGLAVNFIGVLVISAVLLFWIA
jgi:sodium-dependent dicarboxylate transporter 2/3/5